MHIRLIPQLMRLCWVGLALHLAAIAAIAGLRMSDPVKNLYLTSRSDTIIIWGKSHWGLYRFVTLRNWPETLAYLNSHELQLPEINYTEIGMAQNIKTLQHANAHNGYYSIVWQRGPNRGVLQTPDAPTAQALSRYVRYQSMKNGALGFSVALERRRP